VEHSPLRDWVTTRPFIPFVVTLSSGREVQVLGPEMIILGRRWDTVAFVDQDGHDRIVVIRHNHIVSIDAYDPVQTSTPPE
jgi:hypothetical protein